MFELKKVQKGRKRLKLITSIIFKIMQLLFKYREKRDDYGIEIFEYFYLPWRSDKEFNDLYQKFHEYTLNPESRVYNVYKLSQKYLKADTSFIEVGTWKGGVSAIVAHANSKKNVEYYLCDTFEGVVKSSKKDTFFKDKEYSDASIEDVKSATSFINSKVNLVSGTFPESFKNINLEHPISFAHIDVDTYNSAKDSIDFILNNSIKGAVLVLDDYGGWFTDGVTKLGNELIENQQLFAVPNHIGQLILFKI